LRRVTDFVREETVKLLTRTDSELEKNNTLYSVSGLRHCWYIGFKFAYLSKI